MYTHKRPTNANEPPYRDGFPTPGSDYDDSVAEKSKKRGRVDVSDGFTSDSPTTMRPLKNARRRKGAKGAHSLVSPFMNLPLDIYEEIFKLAKPVDLLNLSHVSMNLYTFLNEKSSSRIWKAARHNIPTMPDCPPGMSELRYARVAFGSICDFCDRDTRKAKITSYVFWNLRARSCKACMGNPDFFMAYLPDEHVLALADYTRGVKWSLYSRPLNKRWWEEFNQLDPEIRSDWVLIKIVQEEEIAKHAAECENWAIGYEKYLAEQVMEERKAQIIQQAKALGWEDELLLMPEQGAPLLRDWRIVKACRKELKPRVLLSLNIYINSFMQSNQTARIQLQRKNLIKAFLARLEEIRVICTSHLPVHSIAPTTADLFLSTMAQEIFAKCKPEEDFDVSVLNPLWDKFSQFLVEWYKETERKLLHMVEKSKYGQLVDSEVELSLASTLFSCSWCASNKTTSPNNGESMRYINAMAHSCTRTSSFSRLRFSLPPSVSLSSDLLECLSENTQYGIPWNLFGTIETCTAAYKVGRQVAALAGLDPYTATAVDMDSVNAVFECLPCRSEYTGRCTMTWDRAIEHKKTHHSAADAPAMVLARLSWDDEINVIGRIVEELSRQRSSRDYTGLNCVHCKLAGNVVDLKKHILSSHHQIEGECKKEAWECIVLPLGAPRVPEEYWLWPCD